MTDDDLAQQAAQDEERRAAEEQMIAERNTAQRAADQEDGPRERPIILDAEGDATAAKGFPAGQEPADEDEAGR